MTMYALKLKSAFAWLLVLGGSAQAANLAPHRAIYDLSTVEVSDKAPFQSAEGRLAYEVQGSECEGWAVTYRIANRYSNRDGTEQVFDTQVTSWEAGDGTELRVNQKLFVDSKLSNEYKITIKRDTGNSATEGIILNPAETKFKIVPDTFFTMNHQGRVVDAAKKGESRDSSVVFDGSDDRKSFRIISFIGKERTAAEFPEGVTVKGGDGLRALKAWPVTMSYYPAENEQADEPTYQSTLTLIENGVAMSLDVNYGTHVVKGKLTSLEMLPKENCK
jgi:hypothetical protein